MRFKFLNIKMLCLAALAIVACALISCQRETAPQKPNLIECGGLANFQCPQVMFCELGNKCGGVDQEGVCKFRPGSCPTEENEVCGCDGKTYANECFANIRGISVNHDGPCTEEDFGITKSLTQPEKDSRVVCSKDGSLPCPGDQYCDIGKECGGADGKGGCKRKPAECSEELDEVCGCDSKTYPNSCLANLVEVTVRHSGKCSVAE